MNHSLTPATILERSGNSRLRTRFSSGHWFLLIVMVILLILPVVAATAAPPPTRSAKPGAGYVWGAALGQLQDSPVHEEVGGWNAPSRFTTFGTTGAKIAGRKITGLMHYLMEPFSATVSGNRQVGLRLFHRWFLSPGPAAEIWPSDLPQLAFATGGAASTAYKAVYEEQWPNMPFFDQTWVMCGTSAWARPSQLTKYYLRGTNWSNAPQPAELVDGSPINQSITDGGGSLLLSPFINSSGGTAQNWNTVCPYLFSMNLVIGYCTFTYPMAPEGWGGVINKDDCQTTPIRWVAEDWFNKVPYGYSDEGAVLCELNPQLPDCVWINPNQDVGTMCDNGPTFNALDWSWLPEAIRHYARCLFVPLGWDRDSTVEDAWNAGPVGQVVTSVQGLVGAMTGPMTCGNFVNAVIPFMGEFKLNSCTFNDWPIIRTVLQYVLLIGTAIALSMWIISVTVAVFTKQKLSVYLGFKADDDGASS